MTPEEMTNAQLAERMTEIGSNDYVTELGKACAKEAAKRLEVMRAEWRTMESAERLFQAVQSFRNLDMLGPLGDLRGTEEYSELCAAWKQCDIDGFPRLPPAPQETK